MQFDLVINPTDLDPAAVVEAARVAEDAGFDGVWTYDHLSGKVFDGTSTAELWTTLGAIGAATSRVMVGPLVANATIRHPAVLANAAATLQGITNGRAMLGIGAGAGAESPFADELTMLAMESRSAPDRREILTEAIAVIRHLWSGGGDLHGRCFSLQKATGFIRPQTPPTIIVGANGPKMAALAGREGDGINLHSYEETLDQLIATARDAANGRKLSITVHAPLADEWLDHDHRNRQRLESLAVDRLILAWTSDLGTSEILRAGRAMHIR